MPLASKIRFDHPFAGGYPGIGGQPLPTDPDAIDYLERVKAADGGAAVEVGVAMAVDQFIKGCKADSAGYAGDPTRTVWDALKASCIMCGARTLAGALVSLRQYGPELWDSSVTPTITDSPGSAGEWDGTTLTMTTQSGELVYFPVFTFGSISATAGVQYRVSGRFVGDYSHVSRISFGGAVKNSPATSQDFSFTLTAASSASFAIHLRGTDAPSSVRIESLSIKEVINDATNVANNFASGDYDRSSGLKGDGATKYLDSNYVVPSEDQNDVHLAVYGTYFGTGSVAGTDLPSQRLFLYSDPSQTIVSVHNNNQTLPSAGSTEDGFLGGSRSSSAAYTARTKGVDYTITVASTSTLATSVYLYAVNRSDALQATPIDARFAFYSIGSALDLAALDNRVSTLVAAIAAAL